MFGWIRDFFFVKQTFVSAVADLVGVAAVLSATPAGMETLNQISPYAAAGAALLAYLGGVVSGRKTEK